MVEGNNITTKLTNNKTMNITVAKIRELLVKDYGWNDSHIDDANISIDEFLEDTLHIINDILKEQNC